MHYENEPVTQNRNITTRDIADAIDILVLTRILEHSIGKNQDFHDKAEMAIRTIADGLKQHSGAHGVYVDPNPKQVWEKR